MITIQKIVQLAAFSSCYFFHYPRNAALIRAVKMQRKGAVTESLNGFGYILNLCAFASLR
jgi:hypothetical protein